MLPVITSSAARATPARATSRCVPPPPGVRPTVASTRPNDASSAAHIRSQPRLSSNPMVRFSACTTAIVGTGPFPDRRVLNQLQVLVAHLSLTCYLWLQFEAGSER